MKNLLIALWLLSSVAFAEGDACSISSDAMVSVLDPKAPTVAKHIPGKVTGSAAKGFGLEESVELKGGIKIEYQVGGCEHFSYSYKYTGFTSDLKTKDTILALAEKLLTSTPLLPKANKTTFLEAIQGAKKSDAKLENGFLFLTCGDATCDIDVSEKKFLKINYSFAL